MPGKIIDNKIVLTIHVGRASGKVKGKKVEFDLQYSMTNGNPVIHYKNKFFILTWEEIADLAEDAGLFEEGETEDANIK